MTLRTCVQAVIVRLLRVYTLAFVTGEAFAALLGLCALHAIGPCARAACEVVVLVLCTLGHDAAARGASNGVLTSAAQRASTWAVVVSG